MYYIYRITNKVNGKTYIGQHKYKDLNDGYMGSGILLRKARVKYGIENFKRDILVFNISKKEHADLLEKTFIAAEREKVGKENCYNISDGGQGGNLSEETKKKLSEAHKGKERSEETKRKISEAKKGNTNTKGKHWKFSEETKKRIFEARKGKPRSEEWKKKLSEALKGRHLSEETRKKMSEAHKGKTSPNKGKHISEEHKKRLSEVMKVQNKGKHWKLVDGKRVWYEILIQ